MKITLPQIDRNPDAKNHPYPYQIGMQARRFLQGAIFYPSLVDLLVGQYFNEKKGGGYKDVKDKFIQAGLSRENWELTWSCFEEYINIFPSPVYQSTIFALKTYWDWYISRLVGFIQFARQHVVQCHPLSKEQQNRLEKLDFEPFRKQFEILNAACNVVLTIEEKIITSLEELTLVRNLGMHSLWEVDDLYLSKSKTTGWHVDDIRSVTLGELQEWHNCLQSVIQETYTKVSKQYADVPDYS